MLPPPLLDNDAVTRLVLLYQRSESEYEREQIFRQISEMVCPLIGFTIFRYRWDLSLAESQGDLLHSVILKLPRVLQHWKADNGTSFVSYLISAILNSFRHIYAKRQRRARYQAEWPVDEDGNEVDFADCNTERLRGNLCTMQQRGREVEKLMFEIPLELARLVEPELSGLVHFVAERYLCRADNGESLFFTELRKEVAALPNARALSEPQVDALVRMVIAGVRARLYPLRRSAEEDPGSIGFLSQPPGESTSKGFLSLFSHRIWPLLLILDPAQTRLLLHCLAGIHESVPARDKWFVRTESERRQCAEAIG